MVDKKLLSELENYFLLKCPRAINVLQDGRSPKEIKILLATMNFDEQETLSDLYSWKNGVTDDDFQNRTIEQLEIFPSCIMLSIQMAIETYSIYVNDQRLWHDNLFPLFTDGGGEYYLLDINVQSKTDGFMFMYAPSLLLDKLPITIFDSINKFFESMLMCFEKKAFTLNLIDSTFEVDYELRNMICSKLNPNSKYWKL